MPCSAPAMYRRFKDGRLSLDQHRTADRDAQFERGVNFQGMGLGSWNSREPDTADAEAPHEGRQQNAQRYGSRSDGELQQLVPDNFVNQRAHAAGRKQNQEDDQRESTAGLRRCSGQRKLQAPNSVS